MDDEDALEGSYHFCRSNPLDADAVLVDEASMLDINLAAALLESLGPKTQLVLVGELLHPICLLFFKSGTVSKHLKIGHNGEWQMAENTGS